MKWFKFCGFFYQIGVCQRKEDVGRKILVLRPSDVMDIITPWPFACSKKPKGTNLNTSWTFLNPKFWTFSQAHALFGRDQIDRSNKWFIGSNICRPGSKNSLSMPAHDFLLVPDRNSHLRKLFDWASRGKGKHAVNTCLLLNLQNIRDEYGRVADNLWRHATTERDHP